MHSQVLHAAVDTVENARGRGSSLGRALSAAADRRWAHGLPTKHLRMTLRKLYKAKLAELGMSWGTVRGGQDAAVRVLGAPLVLHTTNSLINSKSCKHARNMGIACLAGGSGACA